MIDYIATHVGESLGVLFASALLAGIVVIAKRMGQVRHQLMRNGGDSLADRVEQIAVDVERIRAMTRAVPELMPDGVFESDAEGLWVRVNSMLGRISKRSAHEFLGNGWMNAVHPDDRDRVFSEWRHCVEQHREFAIDCRLCCPGGTDIDVFARAVVLRDRRTQVIGYLGALTPKREHAA